MERICKNCKLFNPKENTCAVVIVLNNEHWELPVLPNDFCHWERIDEEIQNDLVDAIKTAPNRYFKDKLIEEWDTHIEAQQIRVWSDGKNGYVEG
jgi:hypothetical protein